jgi:biopolymer transport protein ExbD
MAGLIKDKKQPFNEINVTPLVDVMLVLLVVFIVTAPLLTAQSFKVNLPKTGIVSEKQNLSKTVLNVMVNGDFVYQGQLIDEAQLRQVLNRESKNNEYRLQVAIDASVSYDKVAHVMVLIQESGVQKVFFVTEKRR